MKQEELERLFNELDDYADLLSARDQDFVAWAYDVWSASLTLSPRVVRRLEEILQYVESHGRD